MAGVLRVGILGAGGAAEGHARAYGRVSDVRVVGIWNRSRGRAEALADRLEHEPRLYDRWQDMISDDRIDVISIATAPMLRSEPLRLAVDHGRHVLVEKPISIGVPEAADMVAAAKNSTAVTAACFNWRYAPAYQTAWRAIRAGEIGTVRDIRTEWNFRVTTADLFIAQPWARLNGSNGSMGEGLSHELDKARFLTGCEFTKIVSVIAPITLKQADGFLVEGGRTFHLAELSNGVIGQFSLTVMPGQDRWNMSVIGDEGSVAIPDAGTSLVRQRADDVEPIDVPISDQDRAPAGIGLLQHTWNRLIADFVRAVRDRDIEHESVPDLAALADGLRTEEVIAAARRSSDARQWVTVSSD
jgi:predicted dehydrogenase